MSITNSYDLSRLTDFSLPLSFQDIRQFSFKWIKFSWHWCKSVVRFVNECLDKERRVSFYRLSSRARRPPYLFRYVVSTMARGWRLPYRGCADGAALKGVCVRPPRKDPSPLPLHCKGGCINRARRVSCCGRSVGSSSPSTASFIIRVSPPHCTIDIFFAYI